MFYLLGGGVKDTASKAASHDRTLESVCPDIGSFANGAGIVARTGISPAKRIDTVGAERIIVAR